MPHLKCVTCRTRYYTPGSRSDPIEDLCPGCGSPFEHVGDLSELVGMRAITARDAPQQGLVERLGGLLARRAGEAAHRDEDEPGPVAGLQPTPWPMGAQDRRKRRVRYVNGNGRPETAVYRCPDGGQDTAKNGQAERPTA